MYDYYKASIYIVNEFSKTPTRVYLEIIVKVLKELGMELKR